MKKRVYVVLSMFMVFLIIAGIMLSIQFTNKNVQSDEPIGKVEETQEEKTDIQALGEWEDLSANWDTSRVSIYTDPTGRTAPVPIGFTASSVESEKYIDYNVEKKGTWEDLNFSSSGTYPWTQNASDNIWQSGNYNIANSTSELESNEFTVGEDGAYLSIECSVSSAASGSAEDPLSIVIVNTDTSAEETVYMIRGTGFGTNYNSLVYTTYSQELAEGKYKIKMTYVKDGSNNAGLDRGYIKSGKILSYDENGADKVTVHKAGGLVIYENGEEVDHTVAETNAWEASKNRNQYVWVPVSKENLAEMYEENSSTKKIKAKLWEYTATGIGQRTSYQNDEDTKAEVGVLSSQAYDNMRYFSKIGSSYNYGMAMPGYSKDTFYKEMQTEYINTIKSIEKYGGFYIGRYETGSLSRNTASTIPVVRRMNSTISNSSWYEMYPKMRNMSDNANIGTSMIWGSLYDETLQWLIQSGEKTRADIRLDSGNWGNYKNVEFQYYNNNGELTLTKTRYIETRIPTGSTPRNSANNIYDVSGNVWEWTLEGCGTVGRLSRGCGFNYNSTASAQDWVWNVPDKRDYNLRFPRLLLHQMKRSK